MVRSIDQKQSTSACAPMAGVQGTKYRQRQVACGGPRDGAAQNTATGTCVRMRTAAQYIKIQAPIKLA